MKNEWKWLLCFGFLSAVITTPSTAESLDKLEAIASRAKNLNEFLSRPDLLSQYGKALKAYQHRNKFRCDTYEKVLDQLFILNKKVPGLGDRLWRPTKFASVTVLVNRASANSDGVAQKEDYTFRAVPRRLHGIWNDPSLQGCLKDGCNKAESTSPERWAAALQDSEIYYVERNKIYADLSVLVTPVSREGKVYPLLSLGGGPELTRQIFVDDAKTGPKSTTLIKEWIKAAAPKMPTHWRAFVMVKAGKSWQNYSRTVDRAIASSDKERIAATPEQFHPEDAMALAIEKAFPRKCAAENGTLGTTFLGLPFQSGLVSLLASNPKTALNTGDASDVRDALNGVKLGNLGAFADLTPQELKTAESTLTKVYLSDANPATRTAAGAALNNLINQPKDDALEASGSRDIASTSTKDGLIPSFNKGLNDSDAAVRGISALNLLQSGVSTPQAIGRAIQAMTPTNNPNNFSGNYGPVQNYGPAPIDNVVYRDNVANTLLNPNNALDKDTITGMIKAYGQVEDQAERKRFADWLAEYLRKSPNPDQVAKAIYGAPSKHDPKVAEIQKTVSQYLSSNPEGCKPPPKDENGETP